MTHRQVLMELASIDELVALRDRTARRPGERYAQAVRLMDQTIELTRERIRASMIQARFAALPEPFAQAVGA